MALYLGSEKVGVTITKEISSSNDSGSSNGIHYVKGTATSDSNGVITFPELNFEPTMITVWNVKKRDWMEESGEDEWSGDYVRYTHEGIMLMAIKQDGVWISQGLTDNSGGMYITNETAEGGTGEFLPEASSSGITENGNVYSYQLSRLGDAYDEIMDVTFNYAIYG